jgi:hypothetical protein
MSAIATDLDFDPPRRRSRLVIPVSTLKSVVLWVYMACGATVVIEPSPYEFMFVVAALLFARKDLRFDRAMIPLFIGLAGLNAGGLLALPPFVDNTKSSMFVAISIYIAISTIFFAALIAKDPLPRMRTIRSGYCAAAVFAAILGIIGYFNVAGLGPYLTLYSRASGPFKDPNVFGPFLVPPMVWITQDLMLGRTKGLLRSVLPLLIMAAGVFLSFSRGAWGVTVASLALMILLTFVTTPSARLRSRIVYLSLVGILLFAALLAVALSIPAIRDVFEVRASFSQYYDVGEMGRFGNQIRSIPLLLERPFGFGPLQFHYIFPDDPHEVYINAFASYGWLGGLSFLGLTATTIYVGWRLCFRRSPVQTEAIAVWACLFVQMAQGFQIDTDHWRHLYLLFGLLYGLAAVERRYAAAL